MSVEPFCEFLRWDSDFFGKRIAHVVPAAVNAQVIAGITDWCRKEHIDCLYYLCPAEDTESSRCAENEGFHLVDIRVTLEQGVAHLTSHGRPEATGIVRLSRPQDVAVLSKIAGDSHHDGRFYADGRFPKELCDRFYATWIEKSCQGYAQAVWVCEAEGLAVGYVSCHLEGSHRGKIGLMAVAQEARGRGLGGNVVRAALDWFGQQGVEVVSVATQGRNIQSQRFYLRCGFLPRSVQLWYHKWFR
jgi:dTDP-4-amino-4,6-dideoxy-D-galactose acyltransferase